MLNSQLWGLDCEDWVLKPKKAYVKFVSLEGRKACTNYMEILERVEQS